MNIPLEDEDIYLSQDMIPIALSQEMQPADLVLYNLFQTSNVDPYHFDIEWELVSYDSFEILMSVWASELVYKQPKSRAGQPEYHPSIEMLPRAALWLGTAAGTSTMNTISWTN
jgi:hypothetical protein